MTTRPAPKQPKAKPDTASAVRRQLTSEIPATPQTVTNMDISLLVQDISDVIDSARNQVSVAANALLTTLYWQIGRRVHEYVLDGQRAEYGEEIVVTVSRQLEAQYGGGFGKANLWRMVQFAVAYPDAEIVATLSRELSWSHFVALIPLKDSLKRDYYAEMCRVERWSVRCLRERIDSMLYERTAISKKPDAVIREELSALRETDILSPLFVFRDPYMLDFLDLADTYSEKDLESAILREIEGFLLELGAGFAFVERQMRITLDGDDYYLDLLFFHRRMQRLVAIELKIGDFKPSDSGQMELYLRWLDRHERQPSEHQPLGIILCAGKKQETVEYLDLDKRGIHVAEYMTELPPREVLEQRLRLAIETAKQQLARSVDVRRRLDLPSPDATLAVRAGCRKRRGVRS
ncbi:MAG: PDDEXK nuclease domain-containing protein [Polyangiaceae bacterium]|nr:PDDEXK nuclease domain-containing protein [Polyangiaceae bacterium]